jgi:hypothetical protein
MSLVSVTTASTVSCQSGITCSPDARGLSTKSANQLTALSGSVFIAFRTSSSVALAGCGKNHGAESGCHAKFSLKL